MLLSYTLDMLFLSCLLYAASTTILFTTKVLARLNNYTSQCEDITLAKCKEYNNPLLYQSYIWVSDHQLLKFYQCNNTMLPLL
jgi:hypothetical protein